MMNLSKIAAIGSFSFFLLACVKQDMVSHERVGECMELLIDHAIWRQPDNVYRSSHMLVRVSSDQPGRRSKRVGQLRAGEKVELFEFVDARDGTSGFLRVKVRVLDGPHSGLIADVPACVPYHPRPEWVVDCPRRAGEVQFNPEIVKPCDV